MLYTLDELTEALREARKAADEAMDEAKNARLSMDSLIDCIFDGKGRFEPTAEEDKAIREANDTLHEAQQRAKVADLYASALHEQRGNMARRIVAEAVNSPDFAEKWKGTPLRYKRFAKAVEKAANLGDGWTVATYDNPLSNVIHVYFDRGNGSREYAHYEVPCSEYSGGEYVFREAYGAGLKELSLDEIADACASAFYWREECESIMEAARRSVKQIETEHSLDLDCIHSAIRGKRR